MAGEDFTTLPVLNSQRTVPGFFLSAPVTCRHKHKANKAMKVGFMAATIPPSPDGASVGAALQSGGAAVGLGRGR